jgi:hypothetical protein
MWKARLDNLSRLLGEEGNPLHSPDVSSTCLRGGLDTTLKVSKYVSGSAGCVCYGPPGSASGSISPNPVHQQGRNSDTEPASRVKILILMRIKVKSLVRIHKNKKNSDPDPNPYPYQLS